MRSFSSSATIALLLAAFVSADDCKCIPSASCWPSETEWASLNQTLSGRLIRSVAPASICYPSEPNYNETACDTLLSNWSKSTFHSSDPVSVASVWTNNTCNPIYPNGTSIAGDHEAGKRGCSLGTLPPYVINATEANHVQAAMRFVHTENTGTSTSIVASRLISRRAVSNENQDLLARTLEKVGPKAVAPSDGTPNPSVSGTMNISKKNVDNALNPAWRDAVVHFITSQSWKDSLPSAQVKQIVDDTTYNKLNALRQLAPESGAYLNEANPFEPGWQWSFSGQITGVSTQSKTSTIQMVFCGVASAWVVKIGFRQRTVRSVDDINRTEPLDWYCDV